MPADLRFAFSRGHIEVPPRTQLLSRISINGLIFSTSSKHPGNSCIMISSPYTPDPVPAQLVYIVRFRSVQKQILTYLGVRRHRPANIVRDPYICFPVLRAQIWDASLDEIEIVSPCEVASHFACLPLQLESQELVATLSLSRVSSLHSCR